MSIYIVDNILTKFRLFCLNFADLKFLSYPDKKYLFFQWSSKYITEYNDYFSILFLYYCKNLLKTDSMFFALMQLILF